MTGACTGEHAPHSKKIMWKNLGGILFLVIAFVVVTVLSCWVSEEYWEQDL